MTSSDPECRLLAGGDLKLTDVRLDHFSSDGPHSASPRQPPSFEAVGVTRQTRGGGRDVRLASYQRGIGATYFLSSTVPKQTQPAGQG